MTFGNLISQVLQTIIKDNKQYELTAHTAGLFRFGRIVLHPCFAAAFHIVNQIEKDIQQKIGDKKLEQLRSILEELTQS
jgi:hypothetical protein